MLTVLKSWLFGAREPLSLFTTPATGRLALPDQRNDEVSIAFLGADINAPSAAVGGQGQAVVAIYRGRQTRDEYLREWLMAQADVVRVVRPSPADNGRRDAGARWAPRCREQLVATAAHDRRDALRPHNRHHAPARPVRPGRLRGPQASGDTSRDIDGAAPMHPPPMERCLAKHAVHISRCLSELGQDEPPGGGGVAGMSALGRVEGVGLSRSIQDMGRGW